MYFEAELGLDILPVGIGVEEIADGSQDQTVKQNYEPSYDSCAVPEENQVEETEKHCNGNADQNQLVSQLHICELLLHSAEGCGQIRVLRIVECDSGASRGGARTGAGRTHVGYANLVQI